MSDCAQAARQALQHPYLYFSAEDLPALRERIRRPPFAERWERLLANAEKHLTRKPPRVSGEM
ncbi:unnamed protein product, partial [marine sediment metagenome]